MSDVVDLDYDSSSLVGPLDMAEVRRFEKWWREHDFPFKLDSDYIAHIAKYHGGRPHKRCFRTASGRERVIDRFLNFVKDYQTAPAGAYHVEVMRCNVEDRLSDTLLPFAVLFAGDLVCFDYSKSEKPSIVVWLHEESGRAGESIIEPVAVSFRHFLAQLYEPPKKSRK